ncbi:MAG: hypothetical protein GC160_30190 [Acidobacteria bacterium]|nr:hypothetical protein [Acidobacteriota bacterium]
MSTHRSSPTIRAAALLALACGLVVEAQTPTGWGDPAQAFVFRAAPETAVELAGRDFSRTQINVRGAVAVVELRCRLTLVNRSDRVLRSVTLAIQSAPGLPGGKATVMAPSLAVAKDEEFAVDVNLRLVRPLPAPGAPLAEMTVDGVLYADLSFRGPDASAARRRMTLFELEARRDRQRLAAVLAEQGGEALRKEALAALDRQASQPALEARLAGGDGRAISPAVESSLRPVELASLEVDETPLELLEGAARVAGARAMSPTLEVRNVSGKAIRDFEVGWVVNDRAGRRYAAGAIPSTGGPLQAGDRGRVDSQRLFEFRTAAAEPFEIGGMSGYVRRVEFVDGSFWIPSRKALDAAALLDVEPPSSEEARLATIYRRQGLQGLINELGRF